MRKQKIYMEKRIATGRSLQTAARSATSEKSRSGRNTTVHNIEQEPDQCNVEDHIDIVNINLIIFNSKQSAITANLKASSITIMYKNV